jgi:phosphoserine phosphatase
MNERLKTVQGRTIKLALFDLDGTLTKEKSAWEYIHRRLGVWDGYAEKFQQAFLRGEIDYHRFCELDAAIWKGMKVSELEKTLREIPLHDGIEDLVKYLRSKGASLGIISSGLSFLSEWVKEKYGFNYAVANELGVSDGVLNGEIKVNVHYDRKGEWVQEAQRRFNARKEEILAIGDSTGDIAMFQMAGLSIAFNSISAKLDSLATVSIHSMDLRDLILPLTTHLGPPGE